MQSRGLWKAPCVHSEHACGLGGAEGTPGRTPQGSKDLASCQHEASWLPCRAELLRAGPGTVLPLCPRW